MIQKENIGGVYVIPSFESSFGKWNSISEHFISLKKKCFRIVKSEFLFTVWFGVLFVRNGYYKDGIFRFNISLPKDFPNTVDAPVCCEYIIFTLNLVSIVSLFLFLTFTQTVIFQSELVHPLICPYTGILNISDAFATWNPTEHHLWQLLKYIQFTFGYPVACLNSDSIKISNKEAADLIRSQKLSEFEEKAKECVRISRDKIYEDPPTDDKHYITFSVFEDEIHSIVLDKIKNTSETSSTSPPLSGLSWVHEGEFKALRK